MVTIKTKILKSRHIYIPTSLMNELQWSIGESVLLNVEDQRLSISTTDDALKKLQQQIKSFKETNLSDLNLVTELIQTRRQENADEN